MEPARLVEICTDPKEPQLVRDESWERLKNALKAADTEDVAESVVQSLLTRLELPDAEIRLATLEAVDGLFMRSKQVRRFMAGHLATVMELCLDDPRKELPPPKEAAENLHHYMLHSFAKWNLHYSRLYPQISMACSYVEGYLRVELPEGSDPYLSLSAQRERQRRQERYSRALAHRGDLFLECHRIKTEIAHVFEILVAARIEWEELPVAGETQSDPEELKEVEWMDPALKEVLAEALGSLQKRLLPKLQQLISAAIQAPMEDITHPDALQRNAVLHFATDLRNALMDQRNKITKLGVQPMSRRPRDLVPNPNPPSKRTKVMTRDPTEAKPGYPFALRIPPCDDEGSLREGQLLASIPVEHGASSPQILQSLVSSAPNLTTSQLHTLLYDRGPSPSRRRDKQQRGPH